MIRLIKKRANIVFVDEACFTSNQIRARYWAKAGDASLKIDKAKIGFKCIAVVGAINVQGGVVALLQRDLSIKTSDFVEFPKGVAYSNEETKDLHFPRQSAGSPHAFSERQCF